MSATTPLHALHRELGARMVPFAGYDMPVQYPTGIMTEHRHTRAAAGLFDVSHMGQITLAGDDAAAALESLVPVDIQGLKSGQQRYALFTNATGGILDDLMVTRRDEDLLLVVNAACKDDDLAHLQAQIGGRCTITHHNSRALLALQGPRAVDVLSALAPATADLKFMQAQEIEIDGHSCYVSRSGYTGEDGFEIGMADDACEAIAQKLLASDEVLPVGLGARDSLRLEAGLCLYGHDIDTQTTPVEANLRWALSKARRTGGEREGGYPGSDVINAELENGTDQKRVGIKPAGRAPVREGAALTDADGNTVGRVTSGGFGPSVDGPVAMGYVASALATPDTELHATVRGKPLPVTVAKLPFSPHGYAR